MARQAKTFFWRIGQKGVTKKADGAILVPWSRRSVMDFDRVLLWFSWLSLVFWSGVLIWCIVTIIIRQRQEKKWLETYVPTLQSDIKEPEIQSWLTLTTLQDFREYQETVRQSGPRKKKRRKREEEDDDDE